MHHGTTMTKRDVRRAGIPASKGRPRKQNVIRDRNGKSRGEIVDMSVVMNQPHRRTANGDARKSELLGYPLGRLRLSGDISEIQLRTGNEWGALVSAYARSIGARIGSPRSGSALGDYGAVGYSFSRDEARGDSDQYEAYCTSLSERYGACFERLNKLGMVLGRRHSIIAAARRVCVEERYPNQIELGDLRLGLNALAEELKIK